MARFRFLTLMLLTAFPVAVTAAPLSGTKSVGPTGDYASLTAAIADIQVQTLGGALVLELQAAYISSVETFPLTIPALNGASTTNTVTIRPASGATALSISSADTTAATVDLNGVQYLTIDGRSGGTGATKRLTIANTSTSGVALRFINDASSNTIQYATLRGVNTSATKGTVVFSTTTGTNGNDNNTIDHCDIRDAVGTPANGIYSSGSTGTTMQNNSGNTVSNSNIYNFYSGSVDAAGIRLDGGNDAWTLIGNSFYQTATRTAVAANVRGIFVNNTSGNNFTVTGNSIGGGAANAGSAAWTTSGTSSAYQFVGIQLAVGIATPSSVQGNIIQNFVWTSSSAATALPGVWGGIHLKSGSANIGTVTGNTVGSGTGTSSIAVTTSGNGGTIFGFGADGNATFGTLVLANNTLGSITANGSTATISASIVGIYIAADATTVSGNTIGSTSTSNSMNAATSSTSATGQQVTGILCSFTVGNTATIVGNTVANLNNNYVGTATTGQIRGIAAVNGVSTITGNTVSNLSTTSKNVSVGTSSAALGISQGSSGATNQNISQNIVHSVSNPGNSGGYVIGLYYTGGTTGTNVISRNLVHSISGAVLEGMEFGSGSFTAQNNMVRVGLDAGGATAGTDFVTGISDNGGTAGRNFYHNSVYVGGTPTSVSASTVAFISVGLTNARDYRNNIFLNARSNSGATSKHYAVKYGGTTTKPTGLTAGGNIFLAGGTGGVLGYYNSVDFSNLTSWQTATGVDATSGVADPLFVTPAGTYATVDLHLQASTPAEGGALPIAAVTDDFDGQTRSTLTPTDIGADAGNFTSTGDTFAPAISYPLLTNGSSVNRVLTGWAAITDNSGSVAGGANAPRLYFKKSTDADVFGVANDSTGNGWKYVTATGSGPYSFTLDYSIINGGSVSVGNTIQYFVVAQDAANNLGSSPAGAIAAANPSVQNVSGHGAVNTFSIVAALGGTVTVGPGGSYTSLTGFGGLFSVLNSGVINGNLTVNLAGNTTEDGSNVLNPTTINDYPPPANPFSVTLRPDSPTMRTMAGSGASGLIRLSGPQRVTIDGSFGGSGRYLTFRNTSTTGPTILFTNDASNNAVRNCVIEGAVNTGTVGVVRFNAGVTTGNNNNTVTGNQIRDRSDAGGVPYALVYAYGSAPSNSNNTISNNEMFNFTAYGVYVYSGNNSCSITGNTIYQTASQAGPLEGIYFSGTGTNTIGGNNVHDLTTSNGATGIEIYTLLTQAAHNTVTGNRIWNLGNSAGSAGTAYGIYFTPGGGHSVAVVNNMVALSSSGATRQNILGIYDAGAVGSMVIAAQNTVLITGAGSAGGDTWAFSRVGTSTATVKNNIFLNLRVGGGNHFAANLLPTSTGPLTMDYNVYSGTGLGTAANFFDASNGSGSTGTPISYAQWQANVPSDNHSSAGSPGGNYSTAMFVNAATGDLHLVPGGNVLVNGTGTPVAGVTTDYDGDPRNPSTPSIGADEFPLPDITVTQTSSVADGGSVDFGPVTLGSSSAAKTFTITNPGSADLTSLAVTADGANPGDFTVSALSGTTVSASSGSATFTVIFTPSVSGAEAAAIHIASNVFGAKNPFDIVLTGTGQTAFAAWAAANGVTNDGTAAGSNGIPNLLNFGFGVNPTTGGRGALVFNGSFGAGGTITATGQPVTRMEGADIRALFTRRKDFAATGLSYTVQFSADLNTWQDSTDTPTVLGDDGTNQIVSVTYPSGLSSSGFFRVRVSSP